MDSQIDPTNEEKLNSLLGQLEAERGILERIVYKNKNQHRRSSYFQYLLKVRRDLRLLQSANLEELVSSCFQVINGKRPKQKVHLLESLKRRKYDIGKPNFMERLLGAARLLSQIVEPMLRAATEVSTLLARSFFMGFSLTVLALLARLRVLVQQILLDLVQVFNTVSSLSQKKHSVKITHEGIEVYREFYPQKEDYVSLECMWNTDKFVLVERMNKCEIEMQEQDNAAEVSIRDNSVRYQSIEFFLGGKKNHHDEQTTEKTGIEGLTHVKETMTDPLIEDEDRKRVEVLAEKVDTIAETPSKNLSQAHFANTSTSASSDGLRVKPSAKKVAFVSVKRPALSSSANPTDLPSKAAQSTANPAGFPSQETGKSEGDKADAFFSLLTRGNLKDSLFE
ncbi:hypothetical protein CCACVL1_12863 [Corchorus capsularis]|uniref:Nucleolus and neural progenitor protein-like N-terminal domain-containing protein n=1 Tax=Corchorus capsularis TaxID=210143 RepID=A0A1R3IDE5_COCAP|nr:hypothetical protein CCACVL1_12863 [Corchorus capsularis]